jgi:hypothetical protein
VGSAEGSFVCWGRFNPPEYQTGTALDICDKTLWMLAIVMPSFYLFQSVLILNLFDSSTI